MKVFIALILGLAAVNADKIVGGTDAGRPIPYQVRIAYDTGSIRCGGSLISASWVVSAAHCKASGTQYEKWQIVLGYYDGTGDNSQHRSVVTQTVHKDYDSKTIDYDIMVLRLNAPVTLNSHVGVVALPVQDVEVTAGSSCIVSGWGTTSSGGSTSSKLLKATVDVVSNVQCNAPLAYGGEISENMLCLAASGKDACQGDSGGPAVCNNVLEGIVSWGYGCADPKYPGVYTRVSQFRTWIKTNSGV